MQRGEELIYGGRISHEDLLGDPDLLRKDGEGYIAGDIKSGAGLEGSEDIKKPKKHYGVQVALYTDILNKKGTSSKKIAILFIINITTIYRNMGWGTIIRNLSPFLKFDIKMY